MLELSTPAISEQHSEGVNTVNEAEVVTAARMWERGLETRIQAHCESLV